MGKGMKAGRKPGAGGGKGNMQAQLRQVQAMQQMMEKTQEEIEAREFETSAGGGAVSVKISGKKEILSINLKPEVVDPDDIEMLQDLIMAAVNEGLRQVDEVSKEEMGKVTGGINIPGLF
ncbi:MAG: YbaB/EbfC family nucleoid-associated protein [Clostridia bacterium]|nr:YbaB/EbfC family nucleoid-associated protein [Clostridia bacterium]